jgi:hypothetical protein
MHYILRSVLSTLKPPFMKKSFWLIVLLCSVFSFAYCQDQGQYNSNDDVYYNGDDQQAPPDQSATQQYDDNDNPIDNSAPTYQEFYDQLSPYGTWINYPGQGYVWVPNQVPGDFSPYMTGGHWVLTDMGWTWVSDYAWGWGPFHYGRWFMDDVYGWMWLPGYDWAPAWCVWGDYGGYYCWAPCGPGAIIGPHYRPDARYWHFVSHEHIIDNNLGSYALHSNEYAAHNIDIAHFNEHVNIISRANTYHQSVFFSGPKTEDVAKYTGREIKPMAISTTNKPTATQVSNNHVQIYRPNISRTTTHQPAPSKVSKPEEVRQQQQTRTNSVPERTAPVQRQNPAPVREQPQPVRQQQTWTPPRQSTPRPVQQYQQPAQERGFIPSAAPHYSSPAPMGGGSAGFHGGGGGRR